MQRFTYVSLVGLALALSACGGETEETPDITEAIPLDVDSESDATAGDTPDLPGTSGEGSGTETAAGERNLPDTMETGNNPPDFEPPKGSKVQRIN